MDAPSTQADAATAKDQPEKYIRTFAGDIDAVKKGGTPDLALLSPVPTPPVAQTRAVPQVPPTIVPPLPVTVEVPKNPPLETYENDFSQRVEATHASTATILAAEQDKTRVPPAVLKEPPHISLLYSIAGTVLLIASIVGGYVAYRHYTTPAPVTSVPSVSTPIFVDEREEISGTGSVLLQAIMGSVNRPFPVGTVRLLFVASTTSTINIFSLLPVSAPDVLLRNMNTTGSMAGVINIGGVQSPFFVLSVSSYSNIFYGMLSWEPLMPGHLAEFFPSSSTATPATTTPATTTPATTTPAMPAFVAGFYDTTIANHDVRVYRDASGRDILLYGFWNQATLIIARDAAAFTEIASRLGTARPQ